MKKVFNQSEQAEVLVSGSGQSTNQSIIKVEFKEVSQEDASFNFYDNLLLKPHEINSSNNRYIDVQTIVDLIENNPNKDFIVNQIHPLTNEIEALEYDLKDVEESINNTDNEQEINLLEERKNALAKNLKERKDKKRKLKSKCPNFSAHAIYSLDQKANNKDFISLNGLICVDLDENITMNKRLQLENDPYTFILSKSIGGTGLMLFVKVDKRKEFNSVFNALVKYYKETYDLVVDVSGRNIGRLRLLPYDNKVYYKSTSSRFDKSFSENKFNSNVAKNKNQVRDFIFNNDDFKNAYNTVIEENINILVDDKGSDYETYRNLGYCFAHTFKYDGFKYFDSICSIDEKGYNETTIKREYDNFVKSAIENENSRDSYISLDYFFGLCKRKGVQVTSEKTKTIFKAIQSGRSDYNEIKSYVIESGFDINSEDTQFIEKILKNGLDKYKAQINNAFNETEQLENFIFGKYDVYKDAINTKLVFKNDPMYEYDVAVRDIYLDCTKNLLFNVRKDLVKDILKSSQVRTVNKLDIFFGQEYQPEQGYIQQVLDCIHSSNNKDYIEWAFKKWAVGCLWNWLREYKDIQTVSPLTLVLVGAQGKGKSEFFRYLLPDEFREYFMNEALTADKDVQKLFAKSLMFCDNEFSGSAFQNNSVFKDLSDKGKIDKRQLFNEDNTTYFRRTTLCGASNKETLLTDATGNRRILPINLINEGIDLDRFKAIDKTKFWLEVYDLFKSGYEWKLYKDEDVNFLLENTANNHYVNLDEDLFFNYFSFVPTEDKSNECYLSKDEIMNVLNCVGNPHKNCITDIFTKYKKSFSANPLKRNLFGNQKRVRGIKLYYSSDDTHRMFKWLDEYHSYKSTQVV